MQPFTKEQLAFLQANYAPAGHNHTAAQIIVDPADGETLEQMIEAMDEDEDDGDEDGNED